MTQPTQTRSLIASMMRRLPATLSNLIWAAWADSESRLLAVESSVAGLAAAATYTCLSGDAVGDWVYVSAASTVAKADADDATKIPSVGVIVSKPTTTSCVVVVAGLATGLTGLTAGSLYYLSTTAGAISATAAASPNAAPVGIAITTTTMLVLPVGIVFSHLRSVTAKFGSDLIGYPDSGSKTTAATVSAALDELYVDRLTTSRSTPIHLGMWREVSAAGDVGNIAAIGGVLASDTTPILRAEATTNSWEISWATGNVDPIGCEVMVPPDLDDTAAAFLDLIVYSGSTDAATMGVASSWNGGSEVTDSADDSGTKSATRHTITATIAAADIPASSTHMTLRITPPTHATNAIQLVGANLRYQPKLLT